MQGSGQKLNWNGFISRLPLYLVFFQVKLGLKIVDLKKKKLGKNLII